MSLINRTDRGVVARWWFTLDWALLGAVLVLMAAGVLFSLAASPVVAERLGYGDSFHFVKRQVAFALPGVVVLIGASLMDLRQVKVSGLVLFAASLALMALAFVIGPEIKGAHRWIPLGAFKLQPSEFAKPGMVIVTAWMIALGLARPGFPGKLLAWAAVVGLAAMLSLQPDFGQTVLVGAAWGVMLLVQGIAWVVVAILAVLAALGVVYAYYTLPHVASRIDRFLSPANHDTFQTDMALKAFANGGLFGTGPGGGIAKRSLPDAHTDFIFAVIGEEFGFVAVVAVVALTAFITWRLLSRAATARDPFVALALSGLAALFSLQAIINMAVNLSLLPAKGMTFPFISYGGSSLSAMALTLGLALALQRSQPAGMGSHAYQTAPGSLELSR